MTGPEIYEIGRDMFGLGAFIMLVSAAGLVWLSFKMGE